MVRRSRTSAIAPLVCLALASQLAAAAEPAKRPMTVDDLWAVKRVGAPAVSPDGRLVAVAVTEYSITDNKGQSDLWLVDTSGAEPARRLTWNEGSDTSPAWSPDGRRLAYVSKRGDAPGQIFVLPLAGGEPAPVTSLPVAASDPRWFPDGERIAFLASTWPGLDADFAAVGERLEAAKKDKTKAQTTENRLWRYWDHALTDGMVPHLFVVELSGGRVTDLLPGSTHYMDLDGPEGTWDLAPDGGEIAFSANDTPSPYRTLDWDVFLVSTAGGAPRSITDDNPGDDIRPRYTPDGRSILYGRTRRPEIEADFTRLARYDRKTGEVVGLTETWDAQPSAWTVTPDGRSVLFHAVQRGRMHLWALGMDGGKPRLVARGGTTSGVAAGPAGAMYFTRDSITRPAELMTLQQDGKGEPRALTSFNAALIEQLDLGTVRDVTFLGAGGDSVQMFVVLPPGATAGRPAPLVQVIHGGPHGAWLDQFHYRWNAALFAGRGFVAALVNFHGSTGSGQAFCESIVGAHGDKPFTDIMASTDWLIAAGLVDSTRMVAAGGSYGGYLVNWILGHTTRYRALVSHAGVYDLMAQFASDATWGRAQNYGAAPWEDPSRIDRWSPNRFAANFATPTLVLHGEKDYRVPVTQGIELYGVLKAKGVPARLVVFPEENHWVQKPQASRLWWNEVFAWIEAHTGGAGGGPSAAAR